MREDRCPKCGLPIRDILAMRTHLKQVARDEARVAAVWTLLGIDYADLKAGERKEALERARERGWEVL